MHRGDKASRCLEVLLALLLLHMPSRASSELNGGRGGGSRRGILAVSHERRHLVTSGELQVLAWEESSSGDTRREFLLDVEGSGELFYDIDVSAAILPPLLSGAFPAWARLVPPAPTW
jgi:hypothetical protein